MIISILGTSGAVFDKGNCLGSRDSENHLQCRFAEYDLSLFGFENKSYKNSTHFLLDHFDKKFIFIGTKCAIKFQKDILEEALRGKDVSFEEVEDNDLDEIFEKIYTLLDEQEEVLLDITHGFRHQPIMAIFASTLSQFLEKKSLKIIFAKEVKQFEKYQYIYLDDYIEITQISLLLTGFIRTLNFIPIKNMRLLNNKVFEDFSKSLLSNDIKGVEVNHKKLKQELENLYKNSELKHLYSLFDQVEDALKIFEGFEKLQPYEKYFALAKLTIDKNYLIIALSYLFESFREYCNLRFKPLTKDIKLKKGYVMNTAVMDTISNFKRNGNKNKIQIKYPELYKKNQSRFKRVATVYKEVQSLRNDLAHINQTKSFQDIKIQLNQIAFKIETIYKEDVLKRI